jgi:hypothetical protein
VNTPQVTPSQLAAYASGIEQAGLTLQQVAYTMTTALERLAGIASDAAALTVVGWSYASLVSGIANDSVGTIRKLLLTLRALGSTRDSVTVAMFGADLASEMTRLGSVFALAAEISKTTSAVAN